MTEFEKVLREEFQRAGLPLTDGQAGQMQRYYDCLLAENQKYNLTAITGAADAAKKHFLDSAAGAALLPTGASVVDVGSGAGFPIAPLKILREDIGAYALEASQKKCGFIQLAVQESGIAIDLINERAEIAGRGEWRERFDVCVSRAVAGLPQLLELCASLVKTGGLVLAYKGAQENIEDAKNAMKILGLELKERVDAPGFAEERVVYLLQKNKPSSEQYPRKYAQIIKRPL